MKYSLLMYLPHVSLAALLSKTLLRLMLSAFLGGIIGLERELKRRPAGLRTNMFICFGSAMFTILSEEIAGNFVGDHTRIAAQIIPGIGFIGAGSILHSKNGVSGLTTAATLFVVASIGMACGGGLYLPAIFATMLIILGMHVPADIHEFSRRICDRHNGAGADGVEWLFPAQDADIRARLINADGSEAEISGNGTRCVASYLVEQGGKSKLTVRTGAGIKSCELISRNGNHFEFE